MRTRRLSLILPLLALSLAPLALAGCGQYDEHVAPPDTDDPSNYTYAPRAKVQLSQGSEQTTGMQPETTSDPLIAHGDPLQRDDPLVTHSHDSLGDVGGRMAGHSDPLLEPGKTNGWYWVNGSIQSGSIAITVNGIPIGRFSVHIDKEITRYCHPGANTLTFTHYPLGGGHGVCAAHLTILNGRAEKGSPPVLVYDTTAEAAQDAATSPAPQAPDALGAPALPGIPQAPSIQNAPNALADNSPHSDTRSFLDL